MIIIAGNSHTYLANKISKTVGAPIILANTAKFEDQELRIQINGNLYEKDIAILQSTSKPANEHLMELLLLADTARRAGARKIIAIIPYFGYSRQDRPSYNCGPISASLVATLIEASGINKVITVDLHSGQSEGFFKIGVQNLDPVPLFANLYKDLDNCIVISPDVGGMPRAQKLASYLRVDLGVINKIRNRITGECAMSDIIGNVAGKNCIIIDDIIDTGSTIFKASDLLFENGAKSVSACVTHGVFSGDCIKKIEKSHFDKFYITDTINHKLLPDKIEVISVNDITSKAITG
jgi:ribose-phosphate pyrophosphokinase